MSADAYNKYAHKRKYTFYKGKNMEEYLEMISVPAIAVIVYFFVAVIKYAVKENETFKRFIPLISAGLGVALGIVAYFAVPQIMPAENVFVAIIIGGASGLSATGAHQIFKQTSKRKEDIKKDTSDSETEKKEEKEDKK
jgi:hypothetical protein